MQGQEADTHASQALQAPRQALRFLEILASDLHHLHNCPQAPNPVSGAHPSAIHIPSPKTSTHIVACININIWGWQGPPPSCLPVDGRREDGPGTPVGRHGDRGLSVVSLLGSTVHGSSPDLSSWRPGPHLSISRLAPTT